MSELTVLAYAFPTEAASLAAYEATMQLIQGGSAYRLRTPDGSRPPELVVFALANAEAIRIACRRNGGKPTSIAPEMLASLAERSAQAAEHNIVGQRHYESGMPAGEALPTDQSDYKPKE